MSICMNFRNLTMKKIIFFCAYMFCIMSGCTTLNDCECKVEGSSQTTVFDHYDYEGSCSDLEDDSSVSCKSK